MNVFLGVNFGHLCPFLSEVTLGISTEVHVCFICHTEKQIYRTVYQLLKPESNPSLQFKKGFQAKAAGVTVADSSVYFSVWAA